MRMLFDRVRRCFATDKLALVAASDASHALSLENLLASIQRHEPAARVVVYDLGMTAAQLGHLKSRFDYEFRAFEFSKYPAFLDIRIAAGQYAWKPQMIRDVARESREIVCWMDAGNIVTEPLRELRREARCEGYYCPQSQGTISEFTHPAMLAYLDLPAGWKSDFRNLNAACVAFDMRNPRGVSLLEDWARYALIKDCIAPEGSSRANHRQDQALLTVLAYRAGRPRVSRKAAKTLLGFKIHQDVES